MAWRYPVLRAGWWSLKTIAGFYRWAFRHPAVGFGAGAVMWVVGKRRDWDLLKKIGGATMVWSLVGYGWNQSANSVADAVKWHFAPPKWKEIAGAADAVRKALGR